MRHFAFYSFICLTIATRTSCGKSCFSQLTLIMLLSDEGPTLESSDFTSRIGSIPTLLCFEFNFDEMFKNGGRGRDYENVLGEFVSLSMN